MSVRLVTPTESAYGYPLLIKNLLKAPLARKTSAHIVYREKQRYSYDTFAQRVARLANALGDLGVAAGQTVAVMDWDSHRYLECYFAVPMIGAVLHTINIRLSPEQILYTINHAEDDLILVHTDFLPILEAIRDRIKSPLKIVLIDEDSARPETGLKLCGEYERLLERSSSHCIFPDFDENAMATLFYTTGTTGLPKGVCFSHRQIVLHTYGFMSALCAYRTHVAIDSGDVYMPLTPMFHVHAWGMPYLFTMLGTKQVYPGRFLPERALRLAKAEGVTFSHCVPTIAHMMLNDPALKEMDLTGWKLLIGGSALPRGLCRAAHQRGLILYGAYGMSETCPLLTVANLKPHMLDWETDRQIDMRCKTGLPVPHVDLEIINTRGRPLPHDGQSTGEIVVRSPWLTMAYLKDPEKSEELWDGGWLHTGDMGHIDAEGYLQITDRVKDVIKTGGEWISSLELEDIVSRHEAVREAAAFAVADAKWGERPMLVLVLEDTWRDKVTPEEIREYFGAYVREGKIPKYGIPDRIEFVAEIPKTSVGKLDKKVLRRHYGRDGRKSA